MGGDRLILASSDGRMLEVSPEDGTIIRETKIGDPIMIPPLIAGETLYMLSESGRLLAYR